MIVTEVKNVKEYDTLSIITLIVGIISALLFILVGAVAGFFGIAGVILASRTKKQDRYNSTITKCGEILSWITVVFLGLMLVLILMRSVF